ncbi:cysteine-rich motor neuron 1 protein isoform X1 [Hylaeus volcanicus]|uniref:cysteine-rich motor neuron 1 protein isoform X1 n=1 Tax=Hylaeus volcanicus TaxID=313075 RepID=UPI0023B7FCB8|nr:cysteine-rich motor neuron 1 protein isoform X1 [Hylaeus volcanicus]
MRASLLLLGGIVVLSIAVARALSCVCSPLECDILTDEDCPGGLTWDPCKCCKVCARVEGEPCGGLFGFSGSCADGLQCVIKNLLPNTREVDEGVCTKIPGRWRRHCPHGPAMSEPGCNLVSEAITEENGNTLSTGKCVCGPSVPWCPDEPQPYVYATRHECKLNLAAKTGYDDLFSSGDTTADDAEGYVSGAECPEDSVRGENGGCKCATVCPPSECPEGQRPVQVKAADPQTPGSCCARYDCIPSDSRGPDLCPENSVLTEDGKCECAACPPASCPDGHRPVQVRAALDRETPGSCCPLYDCRPSESVSWVTVATEDTKSTKYCIYEDKAKNLGERWQQSDCLSCVCEEDGVSCQEPMCKNCENAIPPNPGECCPHCPIPTNATLAEPEPPCRNSLEDCDLTCDHGYVNDENDCPLCSCIMPKEDGGSSGAQPPVEPDKVCPELPHCGLNCDLVKDEGGCSVCACQTPQSFDEPTNDSVLIDETGKKICPEVKCDLHCERGLVMDENDCTFCKCRASDSNCPPLEGCRKRCNFGYKTNKRGCPICRCRASCSDHLNETHPEGSTWHPNACTTCICEAGGRLGCRETICSVACSNPLPPKPGTCCPVCPITHLKQNETSSHQGSRSWGTVPITVIVILSVFCLVLIVDKVRSRFRGRLSPSEASFSSYPPQYYKYVPAYDTPMHRNEKIAPV